MELHNFPPELNFWWVNNKQTHVHEVGGNYIWSPITRSDGGKNIFYDNMLKVQPGDVVLAFAHAAIKAVGICTAPAILAPKPDEFGDAGQAWSDEGWLVRVTFQKLSALLRVKDHMVTIAPYLPAKYSPIQANGNGNQGAYLAAVPLPLMEALLPLLDPSWSTIFEAVPLDAPAALEGDGDADYAAVAAIRNRTDIGETEKLQLVKSRRGQGIYRQNLEQFEHECRLTRETNRRHLKASHIKPWRVCSNAERLDGNNGLLLSPHTDHLFDHGYLSFEDNGRLIVSPLLSSDTLQRWGLRDVDMVAPFRPAQWPYLEHHRRFILKRV